VRAEVFVGGQKAQCATVVANRARQNSTTPKPVASPIATTGSNGSFIAAMSAWCDALLRTPKKLHITILSILRKVTTHLSRLTNGKALASIPS
jgi:hypothetical protein